MYKITPIITINWITIKIICFNSFFIRRIINKIYICNNFYFIKYKFINYITDWIIIIKNRTLFKIGSRYNFIGVFIIIYIEKWEPECREEEERIKLYDSDGKYLDYFSTESIYETSLTKGISPEDYYLEICSDISNLSSVEELADYLYLAYEIITKDTLDIALILIDQNVDDDSPLEENEWVNHIGDYWILIAE